MALKKTTKSFIKKLLAVEEESPKDEIAPDNKFFELFGGGILKTPGELILMLKTMTEENFNHHTKEGRNDFANWLWFVFDEKKLADKIFKAKTQTETLKILEKFYS